MMLYKRVELSEGNLVQFLGIYATRWPYDSGVDPTVGFIECDVESDEARAAELQDKLNEVTFVRDAEMQHADELIKANRELSESVATLRAEVAQLEAHLAGSAATVVTLTRERDEARGKCDDLRDALEYIEQTDEHGFVLHTFKQISKCANDALRGMTA